MDKPINVAKTSDFNDLKAGDRYTQVNVKSYSYIVCHYGVSPESLNCVFWPLALKGLERNISYVSSDYILIQGNVILLNVEFEK
jgi:hypothetical protein